MAEALAVVGAVASILQLAQYSQHVIGRVAQFRSDTQEIPQAFRSLQVAIPFITTTLVKIKARADAGDLLAESDHELLALLRHCEAKIRELNLILSKHLPAPDASRIGVYWKAILSVGQDKKVRNVSTELMEYVKLLTLHSVTAAPTAEEISSIVTSDLERTIGERMRETIGQLKESSSSITNFNNHSQQFVNRSNRHVYYNGQTQITNHFYFNVSDSKVIDHIGIVQGAIEGRVPKMISAKSHSHPPADFMQSRQDSFDLPESVPVASSSTQFSSRMISGPESFAFFEESKPTVWEKRNSAGDLPEIRLGSSAHRIPQFRASPYAQRSTSQGFVEALESSTSLPEAVQNPDLSRTNTNASARTTRSVWTMSSSRSENSIHTVHSANSLSPPLPDYFELDAPISGITAVQFESPRLEPGHRRPSSAHSAVSESYSDANSGSGVISPISSEVLSEGTTLADGVEDSPLERLESANSLLRYASSNVSTSNSQARKAYADAIIQYLKIQTDDPVLQVRKFRSLTSAELGLSLVVAEQIKHIERAEGHARSALAAAARSPDVASNSSRVRLDQANIKARRARIQEKGRNSMLLVGALHGEALDLFQEVVRELGPRCCTLDDYNAVAQALLGSARTSKKLSAFGVDPTRRVLPAEVYLKEALEMVGRGFRLSEPADAAAERLMETKEMVQKMLAAP